MKRFRLIAYIIAVLMPMLAHGEQWRLHPTYDGNLERIIDTPKFTYFLSHNQPVLEGTVGNSVPTMSLWRYDKSGDEIVCLNKSNLLSESIVYHLEYNAAKKYLLIAYESGNIDLLYDDESVINIPGLKLAGSEYAKTVSGASFSPETDEAFIATEFGFFVIDDKNGEIKYTRKLDKKLNGVVRMGDTVLLSVEGKLYRGSPQSYKIEDFSKVDNYEGVKKLLRLDKNKVLVWFGDGWDGQVYALTLQDDGTLDSSYIINTMLRCLETTYDGAFISGYFDIVNVDRNLNVTQISIPETERNNIVGHWNGSEYWFNKERDGIMRKKRGANGVWGLTSEPMFPNASNAYKSDNMVYHPKYGMLVRNHGINDSFPSEWVQTTDLVSALQSLTWVPMSAAYRSPSDAFIQWNPNGIAIDPKNSDHVYSGSYTHGLMRLDLADPSKSLRLGRYGDPAAGSPGFVGVCEDMSYILSCTFSAPGFDNYGNLWVARLDYDKSIKKSDSFELWYWTPADRLETKDASSYKPLKKIKVPGVIGTGGLLVFPFHHSASKNILMCVSGGWGEFPVMLNHKGTLENTSDDEITHIRSLTDRDGNRIDVDHIYTAYEDSNSGLVWVGSSIGVFTLTPEEFIKTGGVVNRIKVARDDGTGQADYLLSGVKVKCITADPSGRKWFATAGGGIVITSADGTEVIKSYTADNSPLPDNIVYGLCYNPENNSMMISTEKGLAEVFLSSSASGSTSSDILIYPNPVRPDYFGYVNIEGLQDNALVKVVDAGGNLVKEIGFASGGEAKWDITNLNARRVPGGVYYILATGGPDSDSFSAAGKVLVVN